MRPVVVTRAEPGAARTVRRLVGRGIEAVNAATARIVHADIAPDLSGVAALAFTSPNGVSAFARSTSRRDLPVMAVGAVTAAQARAAGFASVTSADGDGAALARLIAAALPDGPILHVTGAAQGFDLAAALGAQGVRAQTCVMYEAVETGALSPKVLKAMDAGAVVLVHSPLGAKRFAARLVEAGCAAAMKRCDVAAISAKAAAPLSGLSPRTVKSAETPDEDALFKELEAILARPTA